MSGHNAREAGSTLGPSKVMWSSLYSYSTVFLLRQYSKGVLTDRERPEQQWWNKRCRTGETKRGNTANVPSQIPRVYRYIDMVRWQAIRHHVCNWSGRYTSDWSHMQYWYCDTEAVSQLAHRNIKTYGTVLVKHLMFSTLARGGGKWLHDPTLDLHPAAKRGTFTNRRWNGRGLCLWHDR